MRIVAPSRHFVMSRVVGETEWKIERVIEKGETVDTADLIALAMKNAAAQEWVIAEETAEVMHR